MTEQTPNQRPLSARRTWLVARRELRERMQQRAYRVVLVVGMMFVAALIVVPTVLHAGDEDPVDRRTMPVAFVGESPAGAHQRAHALERAATEIGRAGLTVRVVREAQARRLVQDGEDVAVVISGPATAPLVALVQRPSAPFDQAGIEATVLRAAVSARLADAPASTRTRVLAPVEIHAVVVKAEGSTPAAAVVVGVMTLVLYFVGFLLNTAFANGLIGDRTGHLVERLLTAVRSEEHLVGKMLGVGVAGLVQLVAWLAAGLLAGFAVSHSLAHTFQGVPVLLLVWFPVAMITSYVMYAALAAVLVIPVRRIEDVAGTLALTAMLQVVAYMAATTIIPPGSSVSGTIEAMSLVPFLSPILMLPRIAAGDVPAWQLAFAVVAPLLTAAVLIRIAAPAYARHAIDAPGGKGIGASLRALRS
jgi:ABC-2 type transport system permease protein